MAAEEYGLVQTLSVTAFVVLLGAHHVGIGCGVALGAVAASKAAKKWRARFGPPVVTGEQKIAAAQRSLPDQKAAGVPGGKKGALPAGAWRRKVTVLQATGSPERRAGSAYGRRFSPVRGDSRRRRLVGK